MSKRRRITSHILRIWANSQSLTLSLLLHLRPIHYFLNCDFQTKNHHIMELLKVSSKTYTIIIRNISGSILNDGIYTFQLYISWSDSYMIFKLFKVIIIWWKVKTYDHMYRLVIRKWTFSVINIKLSTSRKYLDFEILHLHIEEF